MPPLRQFAEMYSSSLQDLPRSLLRNLNVVPYVEIPATLMHVCDCLELLAPLKKYMSNGLTVYMSIVNVYY